MDYINPHTVAIFITFLTAIFWWYGYNRTIPYLKFFLPIILLIFIWVYTNGMNFPIISVKSENNETIQRKSPLHWHDSVHYYLGSKYFKELGYTGLYEAIILADSESKNMIFFTKYLKNLSSLPYLITRGQALDRAKDKIKPRFSSDRWQEFSRDVDYIKKLAPIPKNITALVFDAGYNPPPSWTLFAGALANIYPINYSFYGIEAMELLPIIDIILLIITFYILYQTFGVNAFIIFSALFAASIASGYNFNFGCFLRYTWFSCLALAICSLKKEHYMLAGILLTLTALDRVFPVFFIIATSIWLLVRESERNHAWKFITGVALSGTIIVALSVLVYGIESWVDFIVRIGHHNTMIFSNHIGFSRVLFYPEWLQPKWDYMNPIEGSIGFIKWNNKFNQLVHKESLTIIAVSIILICTCLWLSFRVKLLETTMFLGITAIFIIGTMAHYYYNFLPLIFLGVICHKPNIFDKILALGIILWFMFIRFLVFSTNDNFIQSYWISVYILILIMFWILLRIGQYFINRRYAS